MQNDNREKSRIPAFATLEEEAEFWDAHSFEEFEDELEEVDDLQFVLVRPEQQVSVSLDLNSARELRKRANDEGITPAELVRRWVEERLRQQAS